MSAARAARELISDPKRWTRSVGARDAHGRPVEPKTVTAVRFCALGAADRVTPDDDAYFELTARLHGASQRIFGRSISALNDATVASGGGHKRVLAALDAVIGAEG